MAFINQSNGRFQVANLDTVIYCVFGTLYICLTNSFQGFMESFQSLLSHNRSRVVLDGKWTSQRKRREKSMIWSLLRGTANQSSFSACSSDRDKKGSFQIFWDLPQISYFLPLAACGSYIYNFYLLFQTYLSFYARKTGESFVNCDLLLVREMAPSISQRRLS